MDTDTRTALGQAYKRWMKVNSLSQQCSHDLAKAAQENGLVPEDSAPYAPWNSQVSLFTQNPCKLDPKAGFWIALGRFNAAIDAQAFPGNITRTLRDKLIAAKPFCHDDGEMASATDFFGMFIGELPIPEAYAVTTRVYTEADVPGIVEMCRTAFRKIAEDQLLNPREAWEKLKPLCTGMKAAEIDKFRSVLSGWDEWTLDEIIALTPDGDALGLPAQALDRLGKGLMVPVEARSLDSASVDA
jgi:hypothetical protein